MNRRLYLPLLAVLPLLPLAGCHGPGGAFMPYTGGTQTYRSYESLPKTVQLIDARTGDVLFHQDIPPGQQLTIDFIAGGGDDAVQTPDLMRWQVWDGGRRYGKLRNAMSVPNAASRRLDVFLRDGMEYAPVPPNERYRTDQVQDRPDWWTPEGGPLPTEDKHIYDR